jgi:hypothetical protein
MSYIQSLSLLIFMGIFFGCIPKNQTTARCGEGESFDKASRTCIATANLAQNNQPAIGPNQTISVTETQASTGFSFSINSATDDDADTLQYIVVQSPAYGTLSNCMNQSGSDNPYDTTCRYVPSDSDFVGDDYFTYKVFDGKEFSASSATVTISVSAIDDAVVIGTTMNPPAGSSLSTTAYTILEDAGNCQAAHESGAGLPSVTATLHTLNRTFLDTSTNTCYINRDGTSSGWSAYSSGDPTFTSEVFYVDEGGGTDENEQAVSCRLYGGLTTNTVAIPTANLALQSFNGLSWTDLSSSSGTDGNGTYQQFDIETSSDAGAIPLRIQLLTQDNTNNTTNGGDSTVEIRCTDDNGAFLGSLTTQSFTVTVTDVDDPPAINLGAGITVVSGNTVTEDSAAGLSTTIDFTLDEGGAINNDGTDDEDSQNLSINVSLSDTNLDDAIVLNVTDGTSINYTLSCDSDADDDCDSNDDPYSFPVTLAPAGSNVYDSAGDAKIGVDFDMTQVSDYYSSSTITATVTINDGTNDTVDTFDFTILEELDPPVLADIVADAVDEDTRYAFKAGNSNTSGISLQESSNDYEDHEVLWIRVTNDDTTLCPEAGTYIFYSSSAPDETSASPSSLTGYLGMGDNSWLSVGDGANAGDASGNLLWLFIDPAQNSSGTCNVTVSLCDATDSDDCDTSPADYVRSDTWALTVNPVNDAPTLSYNSASSIDDQTINASTVLDISGIELGEGGASDEDTDDLAITIDSSDTSVIPENSANIKIYYRGAEFEDSNLFSGLDIIGDGTGATPVDVDLSGTDSDDADSFTGNNGLRLWIKPRPGATGTSTITLTIADDNDHGGGGGAKDVQVSFDLTVSDRSANHMGWSMITAKGRQLDKAGNVTGYTNPEIYLAWNAFSATNTTISGYTVYRSDNGPNGPFEESSLSDCVNTTNTFCTDNSFTSVDAGKVFYYKVKAYDGETPAGLMDTPESFNKVRVVVPHDNMVFIHRRIANKLVCEKNNPTNSSIKESDKYNHNRCRYEGPGNIKIGGLNYYDIGRDLMVDAFEAGCPYTNDGVACAETGGVGCIGTVNESVTCPYTELDNTEDAMEGCQTPGGGLQSCKDIPGVSNPRGVVSSQAPGDIYFDSVNKKCYINVGHADWRLLPVGVVTANDTSGTDADVFYARDTGMCYRADGDFSGDIGGSSVTKWRPFGQDADNCPYSYENTTCVGTGTGCYQTSKFCVLTPNSCNDTAGGTGRDCDDDVIGVLDPNRVSVIGQVDGDVFEHVPSNTCWTWDALANHWVKRGDCTLNSYVPDNGCTYADTTGSAVCLSSNFNGVSDPNTPFVSGSDGDIFVDDSGVENECYVYDSSVGGWYHLQVGHGDIAGTGAFADNAPDSANDIFNYNDSSCYVSTGTNNHDWFAIETLSENITDNSANRQLSYAGLPPLVFMNQSVASAHCQDSGSLSYSYTKSDGAGGTTTVALSTDNNYKRLPTRLEQIAFSFWDSSVSDPETVEVGASIDSSTVNGCNSSSGGSVYFSAENYPSSGSTDGVASDLNSPYGMRQLLTNSTATSTCESVFGLKDHIGNVAEFTSESMTCTSDLFCGNTDYSYNNGTGYAFEGSSDTSALGPVCEDANADDNCDNFSGETSLNNWLFEDERYNSNYFFLPLGLPSITNVIAGSDSALEIGSSSGIISSDLRGDGISIKADVVNAHAASSDLGAILYGGSYDGEGANGQYRMEVIPQKAANHKTGFRCVIGIEY